MRDLLKLHIPLRSYLLTVGMVGLLGLVLAGTIRSRGERVVPSKDNKFDHFPIMTVAGDFEPNSSGKVIAIDPDVPNRVTRVPVSSIGAVSYVEWTSDHSYVLLGSVKGLFGTQYDNERKTFGPPIPIPLSDPIIHWPAGYSKHENEVADALRLKVTKTLTPSMTDTLAWSPDHTRIAFTVDSKDIADKQAGDPYQDLWIAQVNGLQFKHLGHGSHPHWSPDGHFLLAIDGSEWSGRQIVRYNTDNGTKTVLRSGRLSCFATAVYSPSGAWIAVFGASDSKNESAEGVFLMDNNGHILRKLAAQNKIGLIAYPMELAW